MYKNLPAWPRVSSHRVNGKEEDKASSVCEDWVDNMALNRQDNITSGDNLVAQWEAERKQLSQISKICLEHSIKVTLHKKNSDDLQRNLDDEMVNVEDSDYELEVATGDSSESDMIWLVEVPKATSIPNVGSKPKKLTQPIPIKSPETRNMISSLIPSPSRKEGTISQTRKQSSAIDAKRRIGIAK